MQILLVNLYQCARAFLRQEEGQDLVEYALVVALVAFGAITGMKFLADGILIAFVKIVLTLTSNIT